ncbi:PKD domain-containing protein [Catalinimonas sp. 4WD22]|uniref:PKD domain-containing protein n=1 Tax=Catalinimonas locisalis TaxID=3133978 RepID=UPI003101917D
MAQEIVPNLLRPELDLHIFQFPRDQIPRIDGKADDWEIYPDELIYGTDLLKDTEDGMDYPIDTTDLDVKVRVGWVKGLNRLYFLYEAYDNFWDFERFNPRGYMNDIFEIVVDGDLSGGPFIFNEMLQNSNRMGDAQAHIATHLRFSGVHAQNYHIYTPPVNGAWTLVWGNQPWISEFPQSNYAFDYSFRQGESGKLILEFWITPYDYAPHEGPEMAKESQFRENEYIGLSWSILDFDGAQREGHVNLSHNVEMVKNASYLCAFRLLPLEARFKPKIKADWTFEVIDEERRLVYFKNESVGDIQNWHWDFGDGKTSDEPSPLHQFDEAGVYHVITLEVEGSEGTSRRTRYWEVMLK